MKCYCCNKDLPTEEFDKKGNGVLKKACRKCCQLARQQANAHIAIKRQVARENKQQSGTTYASRDYLLPQLGFKTYRDYLASDLWHKIQARVYSARGKKCYLCGRDATELHHMRYHKDDLLGKNIKFIVPICHECHIYIEFNDGQKRSLSDVNILFEERRRIYMGLPPLPPKFKKKQIHRRRRGVYY